MNILFITHETTRTGAPFVLLHFLRWLRESKPEVKLTLMSLKRGELHDEFKKTVNNIFELSDISEKKSYSERLKNKIFKKSIISKKDALINKLGSEKFDIIYSNTILAIPMGNRIKTSQRRARHIAHIHELNTIIKLSSPNFQSDAVAVDHFIAASNLVEDNLIKNWNIPKNSINTVYECSDIKIEPLPKENTAQFKVGGSGTVHWRKGSDIFVLVAAYINRNYPDLSINFTWVGYQSHKEQVIIDEDLKKLGLKDKVEFVGQQKEPQAYYNTFDIFLMTSREDPFPLVCIEMGMLGKPIICFEGATGSEEIISKGGGVIVPYLNIEEMAEQVVNYYKNKLLIAEHSQIIKESFSQFNPSDICPKYYEVITEVINKNNV